MSRPLDKKEFEFSKVERLVDLIFLTGLLGTFLFFCCLPNPNLWAFISSLWGFISGSSFPFYIFWMYRTPDRFPDGCGYKCKEFTRKNFTEQYKLIRLMWSIRGTFLLWWFLLGISLDGWGIKFAYDERLRQYTDINVIWFAIVFWSFFIVSGIVEGYLSERIDKRLNKK
jgi:hypothetical protein